MGCRIDVVLLSMKMTSVLLYISIRGLEWPDPLPMSSSSSSSSSSNNQHIDTWPVHGVHLITSESPGRCYWPYLWFHQLDEPQHPQALFQSLWRIQQLLPFWHLHKTRQWKNKDFKISNFELNKRLSQIPNGFTQEAPRIWRSKEVKFSPNLW